MGWHVNKIPPQRDSSKDRLSKAKVEPRTSRTSSCQISWIWRSHLLTSQKSDWNYLSFLNDGQVSREWIVDCLVMSSLPCLCQPGHHPHCWHPYARRCWSRTWNHQRHAQQSQCLGKSWQWGIAGHHHWSPHLHST